MVDYTIVNDSPVGFIAVVNMISLDQKKSYGGQMDEFMNGLLNG